MQNGAAPPAEGSRLKSPAAEPISDRGCLHDEAHDPATMTTTAKETLGFQAEVKQLLELMIHSLYSNKEIFLRELVSNASDAADKLRFEALGNPALLEAEPHLEIRISGDAASRTLTVSDNGIGMSRDEVIRNIGTIARSGTREFFQALTGDQAKDAHLIGQFGVGFYSSFIVADRVTVLTRRAGLPAGEGVRWECDMTQGSGEYTIEAVDRECRGTDVILHLRAGEDDLLDAFRLQEMIRKYSDHIALPIVMKKRAWDAEKSEYRMTQEDETVNRASALWVRPRAEIADEQYVEFYKHVAHDAEPPLAWTHNRVEGRQEYIQLLYLPSKAAFDLWDREHRHGLKLYVRRVFIMDDASQLLPRYLRFVRGVIDSNDLPLNVSREILQQSRDVEAIRAGSTKRVLGLLEDLAAGEPEKYAAFWKEFGRVLKEGLAEDPANRERLAKLMRFSSTHDDAEEPRVSLADYVARMKEGQDRIFYVTADTFRAARRSPHLEIFRKRGIEVLLLHEGIDEWLVANLISHEEKPLVSVARGELDLGQLGAAQEPDPAQDAGRAEESRAVVEKLGRVLASRVKAVRASTRLTESPSCLVADEQDIGGNLARILKAAGQKLPEAKPVLEVNPSHPIVRRLDPDDERFADWANLLFEQALLAEGGQLEDPAEFVKRSNELMLSLSP
jgi:molecular chaperone HtpG